MINLVDSSHSSMPIQAATEALGQLKSNSDKYGFIKFVNDESEWSSLAKNKSSLQTGWQQLALIGIGGSTQGLKSMISAIAPELIEDRKLVIFDHIDSKNILRKLKKIVEPKQTLWCITSKSGSTNETLITLNTINEVYARQGLNNAFEKLLLITGNLESNLAKWVESKTGIVLPFPTSIEGRFSVLSTPTLLPAQLLGVNIQELRSGALWALNQDDIVARLTTFIVDSFKKCKWITHFWFYEESLSEFGIWLEQLYAESLGKSNDNPSKRVSAPMFCMGTNDQHSVLQQMSDGFPDKSHVFTQFTPSSQISITQPLFKDCEKYQNFNPDQLLNLFAQATYNSLKKDHPCFYMECDSLNERTLGALYMLYQLAVGTIGHLLNIEIYGQPGVEESKKQFKKLLEN